MRKLTALAFVYFLVSFALAGQTKTLFNGKNFDGWYAFDAIKGKSANPADLYVVENGMIRLSGAHYGYLMSNQSFKNFKLTVQFRWNTDTLNFVKMSTVKNSGIMYLVPDSAVDRLWPTGVQFQVKEHTTGDFIFFNRVTAEIDGKRTEPSGMTFGKRTVDAEKKVGKWNKVEVVVKDGRITQKLNGKIVNQAKNPSVTSGRILLQYEGYPIDFRNIKIKEL